MYGVPQGYLLRGAPRASSRRKKRSYISSILSKNELLRKGPYNRKLFLRVRHGQYLLNPKLALRVEGDWRRIYEVLSPDRLAGEPRDPMHWAGQTWNLNVNRQRAIGALRTLLQDLSDRGGASEEPFDGIEEEEDREDSAGGNGHATDVVVDRDTGPGNPSIEPKVEMRKPKKKPKPKAPKQLGLEFDD